MVLHDNDRGALKPECPLHLDETVHSLLEFVRDEPRVEQLNGRHLPLRRRTLNLQSMGALRLNLPDLCSQAGHTHLNGLECVTPSGQVDSGEPSFTDQTHIFKLLLAKHKTTPIMEFLKWLVNQLHFVRHAHFVEHHVDDVWFKWIDLV